MTSTEREKFRRKMSRIVKDSWGNPETRSRRIKGISLSHKDPTIDRQKNRRGKTFEEFYGKRADEVRENVRKGLIKFYEDRQDLRNQIAQKLNGHSVSKATIKRALRTRGYIPLTRQEVSAAKTLLRFGTPCKCGCGGRRFPKKGSKELLKKRSVTVRVWLKSFCSPHYLPGHNMFGRIVSAKERRDTSKRNSGKGNGMYGKPPVFHGKGAYKWKCGWITTKKAGSIYYRSSWEHCFILLLENSSIVKSFKYEPFGLPYKWARKDFTYFPDFLVTLTNGRKVLVEIKAQIFRGYQQKNKFKVAKQLCVRKKWRFVLIKNKPIGPLQKLLCLPDKLGGG